MTTTEFLQRLAAAALPYVLIIATALFAWLSAAIVRLINAHVANATVRGVLERVHAEVSTAVAEVAQTTTDALKAGAADSKLTVAEAEAAADAAVSAARAYLGTEGVAAMARVLGPADVEAYIRARVEAEVAARKVQP